MDSIVGDTIGEAETEDIEDKSAQADGATNINRSGTMTDDELKMVLKDLRANIIVVGCGGVGGNTVSRMYEEGVKGAKLVAASTDAQYLVEIGTDAKIFMGEQKT